MDLTLTLEDTLVIEQPRDDLLTMEKSEHEELHVFRDLSVGVATPSIRLGDVKTNEQTILSLISEAVDAGVDLLLFSDMPLTGHTCGDLFRHDTLLEACSESLVCLAHATTGTTITVLLNLPLRTDFDVVKVTAVIRGGEIIGMIPKRTMTSDENRFFEEKCPVSFPFLLFENCMNIASLATRLTPMSLSECLARAEKAWMDADLLFPHAGLLYHGAEPTRLTEDPSSQDDELAFESVEPSGHSAPSWDDGWIPCDLLADARHEWTGDYLRLKSALVEQSLANRSIVLYAGAGEGESVSGGVFAGHRLIVFDGRVLAEGQTYTTGLTTAVITADELMSIKNDVSTPWEFSFDEDTDLDDSMCSVFNDTSSLFSFDEDTDLDDSMSLAFDDTSSLFSFDDGLPIRTMPEANRERFPFLMKSELDATSFFRETIAIQGKALATRLATVGARPVLGLSGGLDSTLALLVCLEAAKQGGFSNKEIIAVSMPGPGTSKKSRELSRLLGDATHVDFREIHIDDAVAQHLKAIGHDGKTHDVTFENAQARERTQILMDLANLKRGLVVGTGDLSELALGWCTYNGDQMSMYSVNSSIPKTAVRYLVDTAAVLLEDENRYFDLPRNDALTVVFALREILDRPVSPELLPPHEDDRLKQITEDVIGPYELIDFFLFHIIYEGKKPSFAYALALDIFVDDYEPLQIKKWLEGFIRRFFRSQFKRSAAPEGVVAFPWSLTPQSVWTMPGDANADLWLAELERHVTRGSGF